MRSSVQSRSTAPKVLGENPGLFVFKRWKTIDRRSRPTKEVWPAVESLDQLSRSGQGLDVEEGPGLRPDPGGVLPAAPLLPFEPDEGELRVVAPRRAGRDVELSEELQDDGLSLRELLVDVEVHEPADRVFRASDLLAVGVELELGIRARAVRVAEDRVVAEDAVAVAVRRARPPTEQDPGVAVLDELLAGELGLTVHPGIGRDALRDVRAGVVPEGDDHRLELDHRPEAEARRDRDADDELVLPADGTATDEDRARRREALGADVRLDRRPRPRSAQGPGRRPREDGHRLAGVQPGDLEGQELAGHHRADVEHRAVRGEHPAAPDQDRSRWGGDDGLDVRLLEEGVVVLFRRAGADQETEEDKQAPHGALPNR